MSRPFFIILSLVFFWSCSKKSKTVFELNNKIYKDVSSKSEKVLTLLPPHNMVHGFEYSHDSIRYVYTMDADNRITYLTIHGTGYLTPDRIKAGTAYSEVIRVAVDSGKMIPGYGFSVKLKSGWNALFYSQEIVENNMIWDTSKVTGFFKIADPRYQ